jgi:hypothetical protein
MRTQLVRAPRAAVGSPMAAHLGVCHSSPTLMAPRRSSRRSSASSRLTLCPPCALRCHGPSPPATHAQESSKDLDTFRVTLANEATEHMRFRESVEDKLGPRSCCWCARAGLGWVLTIGGVQCASWTSYHPRSTHAWPGSGSTCSPFWTSTRYPKDPATLTLPTPCSPRHTRPPQRPVSTNPISGEDQLEFMETRLQQYVQTAVRDALGDMRQVCSVSGEATYPAQC